MTAAGGNNNNKTRVTNTPGCVPDEARETTQASMWPPMWLLVWITVCAMSSPATAAHCDHLHTFTRYPCGQLTHYPDHQQTFHCTVLNRPYCDHYSRLAEPQEVRSRSFRLVALNVYQYVFQQRPYSGRSVPTLNLTIALPEGEVLLQTQAVRLDVWSLSLDPNTTSVYRFPGICRLLDFSGVQFNLSSKPALLNPKCLWVPLWGAGTEFRLKLSLHPSTHCILYTARIVDDQNTVLAAAATTSTTTTGMVHAIVGIEPTLAVLPKLFQLTNLHSLQNFTRNTTTNSVTFTDLDSGLYQVTVFSEEFGAKNGLHFPVVAVEVENPVIEKTQTSLVTVLLLPVLAVLLVLVFVILVMVLNRHHLRYMFLGVPSEFQVILVTFPQSDHDVYCSRLLKCVLESCFHWSVSILNMDSTNNNSPLQPMLTTMVVVLFIMPSSWECSEDSREMSAIFSLNSLSGSSFLPAVIHLQNSAAVPSCLQELPRFHVRKDIEDLYRFVHGSRLKLVGVEKSLTFNRAYFRSIYQRQIRQSPYWIKLNEPSEEDSGRLFQSGPL